MAQNTIRVSLLADAARFKAGMADAERATGKFEKSTETAGQKVSNFGKVALAGLVAGAGAAFVSFLGDATKAAMEDALAQDQLKLALQNSTGATDDAVVATEEWISKTALASGVADDELRPALAELARTTGDVDKAQDLLGVAMDIAAAKGQPLETVTKAIGKAALGNVGALGRMGLATKNAAGEMLTFDEVIGEAERTMGGASEAFAESEAGSMARMQVRLDELKEEIGAGLIPILVDGAEALSAFFDAIPDDPVTQGQLDAMSDFDKTLLHIDKDSGETAKPLKDLWRSFGALADVVKGKTDPALEGLSDGLQTGRGRFDKYAGAAREAERALIDTAIATTGLAEAQQEAADPALAALRAAQRLRDAQDRYNDAVADSGPLSGDAEEAALDLAVAQGELQVASAKYAEEGGAQSIDALETMMRRAGVTADTIDAVRRALERLNSTPINRTGRDVTGRAGDQRTEFHSGGVVAPGLPVGTPVAATLLAGESVAPIGHSSHNGHRGGGGTVINVTVNALDPQGAAKAVVQALQTYNRQNGGIPIVVRQP